MQTNPHFKIFAHKTYFKDKKQLWTGIKALQKTIADELFSYS